MKSIILSIILLLSGSIMAQNGNNQLEITPFYRFDKYPKFNYAINTASTNQVTIKGNSFGINFLYKSPVSKKLYLKSGLGFYRYSFDHIEQVNSMFPNSPDDGRVIDDYIPPGNLQPSIIYSTDRYWYNTISLTIGLERHLLLKNDLQIIFGTDIQAYYTISQNYHITYPDPKGDNFKLSKSRYFGNSAKLSIGLQKKTRKLGWGPVIILPVYDSWKKDSVFPQEENNMTRSKWLNGIGIGFSCNFLLLKKKKND